MRAAVDNVIVGRRDVACAHCLVTVGGLAVGLVLGLVCAQRRSTRVGTLALLSLAVVLVSGVIGAVATTSAATSAAIMAPVAYLLGRLVDA
jgi:heme A synthase